MMDRRQELKPVSGLVIGVAGALATASIVALAAFTAPQSADALPAYAQKTGLACGRCHVNPAGGGALTSFGNAFQKNGHKVPAGKKQQGKTSGGAETAPLPPPVTTAPTIVYNDYVRAGAWSFAIPIIRTFSIALTTTAIERKG